MTLDIPVAGTALDPGLWSGKRRSPRRRRTLVVECRGPDGSRSIGQTTDVSRGGMLLALVEGDLRAPANPAHLVAFASELAVRFPDGMEARFGGGAVCTRATVVRLVASPSASAPILLGCRFDPELTEDECRLLGIDADGDETRFAASEAGPADGGGGACVPPDAPSPLGPVGGTGPVPGPRAPVGADVAHRADETPPRPASRPAAALRAEVVAHLFPASIPFIGPRYRGRVTGLRRRALEVDLVVPPGIEDAEGYVAALGADARVVCLRDGRVLWETRARVHRLRTVGGLVRATLRADAAPESATRRAMGLDGADPEAPDEAA